MSRWPSTRTAAVDPTSVWLRRSDVTTAIAGQTRALVLGVLTATVSIGGPSAVSAQLL